MFDVDVTPLLLLTRTILSVFRWPAAAARAEEDVTAVSPDDDVVIRRVPALVTMAFVEIACDLVLERKLPSFALAEPKK
jgi:hypothetical protein